MTFVSKSRLFEKGEESSKLSVSKEMQIDAGVRASERRRPEQPPGRRREDWLEGRCEWVTSRGWRQRVCESVSSRRCSVALLCLVPIHHLSGISQGVMRNVHSSQCKRGNLEHKSDSSNETVSYRGVDMKAISPVRSFRKSSANVTEHSLGISRSKTPVDDPLSLLYNMNDCYSKLKELVPSIPQNKNPASPESRAGDIQNTPDNTQHRHQHPLITDTRVSIRLDHRGQQDTLPLIRCLVKTQEHTGPGNWLFLQFLFSVWSFFFCFLSCN
ncbi:hypothetical protein QQF64_011488 [Cirrhinus molitorella]|uniref:Uncharacterized protein n=1 Tax=Cirrhinus molitorella TaxID=172907 RepID=A0ABR3LZD2_9TELE